MTLRIIHLSDLHFGCENRTAVDAVLAAIAAYAPDLTIVSGDLTLQGRAREFAAARAFLARLPAPWMATPGNHDVPSWNLGQRFFAPFRRYRRAIGETTATRLPDLYVWTLNTARGVQRRIDWSKGVADLAMVRAIAAEMRAAPPALRIFVSHHALVERGETAMTSGVRQGAAAARLLAEAGADLLLSGHAHDAFALPLPFGDGRSYAVGAGTLSLRTRGDPASFCTIEADAQTIIVSSMEWTGEKFARARVSPFPRRRGQAAAASA